MSCRCMIASFSFEALRGLRFEKTEAYRVASILLCTVSAKKSAAAKAKTQPADVKKEQKTKARRAAKSKAAALDVPEVSEPS